MVMFSYVDCGVGLFWCFITYLLWGVFCDCCFSCWLVLIGFGFDGVVGVSYCCFVALIVCVLAGWVGFGGLVC